ncbi:AraC family transcriptional regulator [Maribacter aestuarii]|uniref:AraC family transcriptional regulator n=1 Tax=Maribacter aestuarii TaxID=1130723 RepID=UPI00248D04D2|nr:AraC family transcriptional regulator [Maribacter aestuarii]
MKKLSIGFATVLIIGLGWYLFLKPQDYRINVKANTFPGTINQTLKLWSGTLENESEITQNNSLLNLIQNIKFGDSLHKYEWSIQRLTDSTSKITVDVTDLKNSVFNRIKIPFSDTDFEKRSRKTVTDFIEKLNEHRENFKVTIQGEEQLQSTYCACVSLEGPQFDKAAGMMRSFPFINSVLVQNGLELNGVPFIEVTQWNMEKDSIAYNFCYPIIQSDSLPFIKGIFYQTFQGKKALKAIYNGNYITSDRAWYALLDYAEKNNIKAENKPVEFFFNNPNMGGNELRWKAEVFLPLSN